MRRLALALVLAAPLAACSNNGGSSAPPPGGAPRAADDPDGGANFASPPDTPDPQQPSQPSDVPPELAAKIKREFGEKCRLERTCGELLGIDCEAAVDGPYYYVRRESLEVVSRCGGYCMSGTCTDCPPKAWTCPTY